MIVKQREVPHLILSLEAALGRLREDHEAGPLIRNRLYALQAGLGGEEQVDKVFESNSFHFKHKVFHDISLRMSGMFQIDTLFLAENFALVIEVKNIAGSLEFKENPAQLISVLENGERRGFECPAMQVEKNRELLEEWFFARGITIPIYGVVVLAYAKQIVDKGSRTTTIIFPSAIPQLIRKYKKAVRSNETLDLEKVSNAILNHHTPYRPQAVCEMYPIRKDEILTGVRCEACNKLGMVRKYGTWKCMDCGAVSKCAHEKTLLEWFMVIGGKVSNAECRRFLHLQSRQIATRILGSMDLLKSGTFRNRKYEMKF